MMICLFHYVMLSALLFSIGGMGILLNRRNLIVILMSIELMLLAANINFVAFSYFLQILDGQVFVFFIMAVAACESAIALALIILLYRRHQSISVDLIKELKL